MKHPDLQSNEELSSMYYQQFMEEASLPNELSVVPGYILSTIRHEPRMDTPEELEFLDIDLSILASN